MDFVDAIILGIVEGITEFLPISSTGHMIMAGRILGLEQTEFLKTFEISVQLGGILAVVFLYGHSLLRSRAILNRVVAAFIPTAIVGFILYKLIKNVFMNSIEIVLGALVFGGICFIIFELIYKDKDLPVKKIEDMSYAQAVVVGLFQAIAVVPGISRAGATIIGGMLQGISRKAIVDFSFILAIPTMAAAVGLDLLKNAWKFTSDQMWLLGIGFIVSFIVAFITVKVFLRFVKSSTFLIFGVYRIAIAAWFWWWIK